MDTDLFVGLYSPARMPLLALESSSGLPTGPLIAVADFTGRYRLRVRARYPGRFSLRLSPLQEADGAERDRAAAAALVSQANLICRRGKGGGGEACGNAISAYEAALERWRPELDRQEIALTYYWLGHAWQSLRNPEKSRASFAEARRWFLAAGDREAAAVAQERSAESLYFAGQYAPARDAFLLAREEFRQARNRAGEATALSNLALIERSLGYFQNSLEHYEQALAAMKGLGRLNDQAMLLSSLGMLYLDLEEPQKALDQLQQALTLQQAAPGTPAEMINVLVNLGVIQNSLGSTTEALQSLSAALDLARKSGLEDDELTAHLNRAYVHLDAEHDAQAAADLEEARRLARKLHKEKDEGIALAYLARLSYLRGNYKKASQYSQEALQIFQATGDRRAEAKALFGAALVQNGLRQTPEALASIEKSIMLGETLRSEVLNETLRSSFFDSVRPRFELAVELLMKSGSPDQAFEMSERARARAVLDELAESQADIRAGVDPTLLAREKGVLGQIQKSETDRQSFSTMDADPESRRRIEALDRGLEGLLTEREEVLAQIKASSPRYAALVQPQPRKLAEIQRDLLDRDSLLLSYFLGEEKSFLWLVDREGIRSVELPDRSRIEDAAKTLWEKIRGNRRNLRAQEAVDEALKQLGEMLLPADRVRLGARRLLIIPDGALQFVPFTALPEPGGEPGSGALVESHEIVELPSASALSLLRQSGEARPAAPMTIAAFGDAVFGIDDVRIHRPPGAAQSPSPAAGDLPRLVSSREEVEHILALVPREKSFSAFDFDASLETLRNLDLRRFRMLHLATHGKLGSRPQLSGIFLSRFDADGRVRDNFLSALDVYNLDLSADLVVLSACETALEDDLKSEGVGRLTRAFLYAGAKSVVVSLWSVSDEATAEFIKIFYSAMLEKGMPPAAALREAQRTIRREERWSSPYFWAGFVLQGDWK